MPRLGSRRTLVYEKHQLRPEDLLNFIELDGFSDDWKHLGLDDVALEARQVGIMCGPKRFPVIPGTGGLRKLRFAPDNWPRGKRGGVRVCFVYFEAYAIVLLVVAYGKNEKDDLSRAEKKAVKQLIERQERALSKGTYW